MDVQPFTEMGRVDYLTIYAYGSPSQVRSLLSRWSREVASNTPPDRRGKTGVAYKSYPSHRTTSETVVEKFECWGKGADALAKTLSPVEWACVERCDYRVEFTQPPCDLRELEDKAHQACQGGTRITRDISRPRARRGGRDGGGELLAVGSHASDTRLTVYKRGREDWATEAQTSGKIFQGLLAFAGHLYSSQEVPTMYEAVVTVMSEKLHSLVHQRLGIPFAVLVGAEEYVATQPMDEEVEQDFGYWEHSFKVALSHLPLEYAAKYVYQRWRTVYGGVYGQFIEWENEIIEDKQAP